MKAETAEQEYLTTDEVARLLRVHPTSVARFIREGHLGAVRVGKFWRIPREELDAFIERGRKSIEVE